MHEDEVFVIVRDFLENRFGSIAVQRAEVDLVAFDPMAYVRNTSPKVMMQVECKGSDAFLDRAIGQTLRYYAAGNKVPTFLAVPEDYHVLEDLRGVLSQLQLPLGLILVSQKGIVVFDVFPETSQNLKDLLQVCPICRIPMLNLVSPIGYVEGFFCGGCKRISQDRTFSRVSQTLFLDLEQQGNARLARILTPTVRLYSKRQTRTSST